MTSGSPLASLRLMANQYAEREVTKTGIRKAIVSVESLIQWSETTGPRFQDCITCGTPTFESVLVDAARDAVQFFKDLLL